MSCGAAHARPHHLCAARRRCSTPAACVSDASYPRETTFPCHIHITSHQITSSDVHTRNTHEMILLSCVSMGTHVAFFSFFFWRRRVRVRGRRLRALRLRRRPRRGRAAQARGVAAHLARAGVRDHRARVAGCHPLCRPVHVRFGAVSAFAVARAAREFAREFWQGGIFGSPACRARPDRRRCHTRRAAAAAAARTRRGASPAGVGGAGGRGRARRGRREEGARSRSGGARAGQICSIGRGVGAVRVRVLCEQVVRTTATCVPRARTAAALARATP